jgi:RNA polymerase sigma-70 factor (ECF subfamily)
MEKDQENIIEQCRQGDIRAQFVLYKAYSKAMYNTAIRFTNNKMDAEDILQESFVTAFTAIENLENSRAFGSWLKRIVINNCISMLRSKRILFSDLPPEPFEKEEEEEEPFNPDPAIIHNAIRELPEGARGVLILYLLEGYSHREVAKALDVTESTSRTQYARALKILRRKLKERIYVN